MCNYCDCRSHPKIAALSVDHVALLCLRVLEQAVEADDHVAAAGAVDQTEALLRRHAADEERGVFTQLRHAGVDDAYVAAFEGDHTAIDHLLVACRTTGWRTAALSLIELLRAHIAREERDLFPAAHQLLTPSQWDAIDAEAVPV
jgi:hemerythrin-like domain-containing protein